MEESKFSHEQIVQVGRFTPEDIREISQRRRDHNRLGFAYQLAFVRLSNRFPTQQPMEILSAVLDYAGVQLSISPGLIQDYALRQPTIAEHRQRIIRYLGLRYFENADHQLLAEFLFTEACRLEQTGQLITQAKKFLRDQHILYPSDDVLRRFVVKQRKAAREHIYERITNSLPESTIKKLDGLLDSKGGHFTPLHALKQPPGRSSPAAILRLTAKLDLIKDTQVLDINLFWLNNNYQRSLARYVQQRSASRLNQLLPERRYAVLVCFLYQLHADTIDFLIEMHDKLMTTVYNRAESKIASAMKRRRKAISSSLTTFHIIGKLILDDSLDVRQLRQKLFQQIDRKKLVKQVGEVDKWLSFNTSYPAGQNPI